MDFTLGESAKETVPVIEFRYLYVGIADFALGMGIAARAGEKSIVPNKTPGSDTVNGEYAASVVDLNHIDLGKDCLPGFVF